LTHELPDRQQAIIRKGDATKTVWRRRVGDFFIGLGAALGREKPQNTAAEPVDPADRPHRRLEDIKPKSPK